MLLWDVTLVCLKHPWSVSECSRKLEGEWFLVILKKPGHCGCCLDSRGSTSPPRAPWWQLFKEGTTLVRHTCSLMLPTSCQNNLKSLPWEFVLNLTFPYLSFGSLWISESRHTHTHTHTWFHPSPDRSRGEKWSEGQQQAWQTESLYFFNVAFLHVTTVSVFTPQFWWIVAP